MTAVEILLKIKSLFERKSVDEAKEAVEGVGEAGKGAGAAASEGMGKAADAVGGAAEAADKASKSVKDIGDASSSASMLTAGNIGKVSAAFAAVAAVVKMVSEAIVEMNHVMDGITTDNLAAGVDSASNAVERLERAYDAAARMRGLLATAQSAGIDMLKQEQLASLELAKARELASAKDDDERRRIELRYAAQSKDVGSEREAEAIQARMAALAAERAEVEARIADRWQMQGEQEQSLITANRAFMDKNAEAGRKESSRWTISDVYGIFGARKDAEMTRADADKLKEAAEGYAAQVKESADAISAMRQRLEEIEIEQRREESNLRVNRTLQEASKISSETASRDFEQGVADRKAAEEAAARRKAAVDAANARIEANNERGAALQEQYAATREEWAPRIAAARERAKVASQSAAQASRAYSAFRREGTDSTVGGYDKVVVSANQKAQAAAREVEAMERQLKATLDSIADEMKRIQADTKAIQQQIRHHPN